MYGLKILSPYNISFNMKLPNRQSMRLSNYDYSAPGYYFVTICTSTMRCRFGKIVSAKICLSDAGLIAKQCWMEIPTHYPCVRLDKFIIMPNHIHGIIIIENNKNSVRAQNFEPLWNFEPVHNKYQYIIPQSLGCIIRGFKIGVTQRCRQNAHFDFQWKRNFHDHIIRGEADLNRIRNYIQDNPHKWALDEYHPDNEREKKS